jgi:uncharacterized protein involved in outer membrane biogenesis
MKKFVLWLIVGLLVLVLLTALAAMLLLNRAIKAGVETIGPRITKTDVKLDSASLSLLSGSGQLKGLVVGNPAGFKTPSALSVGTASFVIEPRSLLADKIIIKSIRIQAPEITFETDLRANNLNQLLANVQAAAGGSGKEPTRTNAPSTPPETKPAKRLEVDEFLITGGKIHVSVTAMGGRSATVILPEIHLDPLGQGPEGITAAELTQRAIAAIQKETAHASANTVADIEKGALYLAKDLAKPGTNTMQNVTKGLGNLFKKK